MPAAPEAGSGSRSGPRSGLKQRVITAAIIAPVALALIAWLPVSGLWWLCAALIGTAAYEWLPLAGVSSAIARISTGVLLAVVVGWLFSRIPAAAGLKIGVSGLLAWAIAAAWLSNSRWGSVAGAANSLLKLALGAVILSVAAVCLGLLLSSDQGRYWFVLMLLIIWAADIGAYFTGKRFGRHKLAPVVSPNKTWEGVAGGLALVLLVSLLAGSVWLDQGTNGALKLAALALATATISIIGDLFISMLKRHVGLKDAGQLFPGHGGVLDRFDSLLAAAPAFYVGKALLGL